MASITGADQRSDHSGSRQVGSQRLAVLAIGKDYALLQAC
jgi:hypothetical protein